MEGWSGFLKYLGGVLIGIVLTYLYVRFDFTLPGIARLGEKVAEETVVSTAEATFYDFDAPRDVRQRALAVIVGGKPELFIEVDASLGNRFFDELLRRKAVRKAKLLKGRMRSYEMALAKPALRRMYEKRHGVKQLPLLKRRMFLSDLRRDEYLFGYLRQRFPESSPDELADLVLDVYQSGLRRQAPAMATETALGREMR